MSMNPVVTMPAAQSLLIAESDVADLIKAFLSGKSQKTIHAYRQDLSSLSDFLHVSSIDDAARVVLGGSHGQANLLALQYKDSLTSAGMSPSTVNRKLSALRSFVQLAKTIGIVDWDLQVRNVRSQPLRDTRGVGADGFKCLLVVARGQRQPLKAARDTCILRFCYDLALRRTEVASLDIEDVDLAGSRVMVLGKGKTEKAPMTIPEPTKRALQAWLAYRGMEPGALFVSRDRTGKAETRRFTDNGLYRMICSLGKRSGVRARPHGIRHAAVTQVLNLTGGDLRLAQRFARHSNPSTTILYDDQRRDGAGEAARILAESVL